MTPYTGYATDFNTPGANVAVTAASNVTSSTTINGLKRTGAFTTTIDAGQTLTITSGMILNTSGTGVIAGPGALNFGGNPGVLFSGTTNISSPITGTGGLINANATSTLSGDLFGLSGGISTYNGTTTMTTNTYTGPFDVRAGQLNLNVNQMIGAGHGAITLGVAQNDSNLLGLVPTLSFSGAGANAVIDRDIIVDNGAFTAAGAELEFSNVARLSPLSNTTGSQTLNGDITLNSPLNLQGGGGGGTGATNFTGDITGPAVFILSNGRASFSGAVSNAGGFLIGNTGFTAQAAFTGTGSGSGPIRLNGGNNIMLSYENGALPGGPITVQKSSGFQSVIPLENSSINNEFILDANVLANVGAGITAEWAGKISGGSTLAKTSPGTLVLSNNGSSHTGAIQVDAGVLRVNGTMPSSSTTVASGATLVGSGILTGIVSVATGGIIAPGNSLGNFYTGNLSIAGALNSEIDLNNGGAPAADLLSVVGSAALTNATLDLDLLNNPLGAFGGGTYLLLANDGIDSITGAFDTILGLPGDYAASVNYAFSGVDSLGRIGDGNDIAITLVPEPTTLALLAPLGLLAMLRRRN